MNYEIGLRTRLAAIMPHFGDPIVVDGVPELVCELDVNICIADGVGKLCPNHFEHVAVCLYFHVCVTFPMGCY